MLKTLIIAPKYPLPEDNGSSMRTMNFVRYFKKNSSVDILCRKDCTRQYDVSSPFEKEHLIDFDESKTIEQTLLARAADKFIYKKTWLSNQYTRDIAENVRNIVIEGNYEYIVCRYIDQAYPLLKLDRKLREKIILDVDDIVTETVYDAETKHLTGISKIKKIIDKCVLQSYFKKCMGFGTILFCSDDDKSKVADRSIKSKCHIVPNVCPEIILPDGYRKDGFDNINNLLFVGTLRYEPNSQGIMWFINTVFPRLLEQFKDLKLIVAGRNPSGELIDKIKKYPDIVLHANPPDMTPYYDKCGVVIVPLFAGGGTRIKILESGFAKRPVISTEIGAYGLGLGDGKEIMLFKDSESFVDKYRMLRNDRALYSDMVQRFYSCIIRNYSFNNFCQSMDAIVGSR
jgi:polysaccharide biosynthesis protein PslH